MNQELPMKLTLMNHLLIIIMIISGLNTKELKAWLAVVTGPIKLTQESIQYTWWYNLLFQGLVRDFVV